MTNYTKAQQLIIHAGKAMKLNTACFEDPDYSAERMSAIIETLKLKVPKADLDVMLDKRMSDREAWNLWHWLAMGRTAEEFILDNDELV